MRSRPVLGRAALALVPALAPGRVWACAVCLDSAWGDRGFGWPFIGLLLMPFVVVAALAGALFWMSRRPGAGNRCPPGA